MRGNSQGLPQKVGQWNPREESDLTQLLASLQIAKRTAPSMRANWDRDPGQIHPCGAAQGVYFGKKFVHARRRAS